MLNWLFPKKQIEETKAKTKIVRDSVIMTEIEETTEAIIKQIKDLQYRGTVEFNELVRLMGKRDGKPTVKKTVHGLILAQKKTGIERLSLICTDKGKPAAIEVAIEELKQVNEDPKEWSVKGHAFVDVTVESESLEIVPPEEAKKWEDEEHPVRYYINSLQYALDKFATTQPERRILSGIISKVKAKYNE